MMVSTTYYDHWGDSPYHHCLVLVRHTLGNGTPVGDLLDLTQLHGRALGRALAKLPALLRRKKEAALRKYARL